MSECGWVQGTPVVNGAELRERILAILLDANGDWLSTGQIAKGLGAREEARRERPPYRRVWFGLVGDPCCPTCTDPDHVVIRRYPYDAQDVRSHLKALERQGRVRCEGKHAARGQAATFFWSTSDEILSGSVSFLRGDL